MKKTLLLSSILLAGTLLNAQDITAVTGVTKGKIEFQDFRKIDLNNLGNSGILVSKSDNLNLISETGKSCNCGKYIAAMTTNNAGDIFFIPMTQSRLMTVNTTSKTGTFTEIKNSTLDAKSQATYHARMTTASDGFMYALNNNGTELLKISPNGSVQNLGAVQGFMAEVKKMSNENMAFGGDMIADAFGNLYVISAAGNVFKLNPNNDDVSFIGKIKGLPEKYTVNGAAVAKDGNIVLATTSEHGFYTLNFETLEAKFAANYDVPVYDLSSPYLLKQNQLENLSDSNYSLYPTIVKTNELNIVSKVNEPTKLDVTVWNMNNKMVYSSSVAVQSVGDFKVNLNGALQPGIYILKAVNQNGAEVINTKFTLVR